MMQYPEQNNFESENASGFNRHLCLLPYYRMRAQSYKKILEIIDKVWLATKKECNRSRNDDDRHERGKRFERHKI